MELYPNIYRTLTAGPVVELRGYAAACRLPGRLYAYLDYNGPTGTARDGLAEGMLALAAQRKVLAPGQTLIEAGSGAFAAALALAGTDQRPPGLPGHARQHPRRPAGKAVGPGGAAAVLPGAGRDGGPPVPWPGPGPVSAAGTTLTGLPATTTPNTTAV